jgi:hypothetical protein
VSGDYPDDPVLLSDVLNWIWSRATSTPPFAYQNEEYRGNADAELRKAIADERLPVFFQRQDGTATFFRSLKDAHWTERQVASRSTVLALWPEPETTPTQSFDQYTLLWDAADEVARTSSHNPEWHWLRFMDAFWRGQLSLTHFSPVQWAKAPIACDRNTLSRELCVGGIDELCRWGLEDYDGSWLRCWFDRDSEGRFGLAALTADIAAYQQQEGQNTTAHADARAPRSSGGAARDYGGKHRPKQRTGRHPSKRNQVAEQMLVRMKKGEVFCSPSWTQEALAKEFDANRETVTKARDQAKRQMSELSELEKATNTGTK